MPIVTVKARWLLPRTPPMNREYWYQVTISAPPLEANVMLSSLGGILRATVHRDMPNNAGRSTMVGLHMPKDWLHGLR